MTANAITLAENPLAATWDIGNVWLLNGKCDDPSGALFPNNPGLAMFAQPHCDLFSGQSGSRLAEIIG
jgi:hypothetical protein